MALDVPESSTGALILHTQSIWLQGLSSHPEVAQSTRLVTIRKEGCLPQHATLDIHRVSQMEPTDIRYSVHGYDFVHTTCLIGAIVYGTIGGSLQLLSTSGQLLLC
jgi:hypothetical protein